MIALRLLCAKALLGLSESKLAQMSDPGLVHTNRPEPPLGLPEWASIAGSAVRTREESRAIKVNKRFKLLVRV
jgi:hypothetical protein